MANRLMAAQQTAGCGGRGNRNCAAWPALLAAHRGLSRGFAVKHAIDGWNLAHPLADVLARHGYVRDGRNRWRSPLQAASGAAAVSLNRLDDGREWWTSFSGSDDTARLGAPAPQGRPYARFGESFDIEVHFSFDGDYCAAAVALLGPVGSGT
jgi:hypothetical protein